MSVIEINNVEQLNKIIEDADTDFIIVDFYALWCSPCMRFAPIYKELSEMFTNVTFVKVDVDNEDNEEISEKYNIASLPTFLLFKKGHTENYMSSIIGANRGTVEDLLKNLS